jgi:hypothetical protein
MAGLIVGAALVVSLCGARVVPLWPPVWCPCVPLSGRPCVAVFVDSFYLTKYAQIYSVVFEPYFFIFAKTTN